MKFEPIVPNADLDIHDDPPGLWSRVAVICRWKDAHAFRRKWPHAAVVGPLRTVRGIDELVRNLLHNPQIRVVVIDGPDLTQGEETTRALYLAWGTMPEGLVGADAWGPWLQVRGDIEPVESGIFEVGFSIRTGVDFKPAMYERDRSGGRITLPPPPPKATAAAPHGDPGERVAADTLAELWPMVLQRAMRFGRLMPTQYGDTKELLCLVGVVRDVEASLAEMEPPFTHETKPKGYNPPCGHRHGRYGCTDTECFYGEDREFKHPILGISWAQVEAYRDQVAGLVPPTDRPYSYGSRMRGVARQHDLPVPALDGQLRGLFPDQFSAVEEMLGTSPGTRAAYLTPWRPAEDAGKESGRPCMVGAWFRVEPTTTETEERDLAVELVDQRNGYTIEFGDRAVISAEYDEEASRIRAARSKLHLVVAFRSHDLYGAYGTNLAGIMLWQSETAKKLGMQVGSLTVTSYSAHVYARDWAAAEAAVETHLPKGPYWDQRSTWRVERVEVQQPFPSAWPKVGERVFHEHRGQFETIGGWFLIERYDFREGESEPYSVKLVPAPDPEVGAGNLPEWISTTDLLGIRPRRKFLLRATALTPDGKEIIEVFEAETEEGLRGKIEQSGLVTSIGAALWLGDEIRRKA